MDVDQRDHAAGSLDVDPLAVALSSERGRDSHERACRFAGDARSGGGRHRRDAQIVSESGIALSDRVLLILGRDLPQRVAGGLECPQILLPQRPELLHRQSVGGAGDGDDDRPPILPGRNVFFLRRRATARLMPQRTEMVEKSGRLPGQRSRRSEKCGRLFKQRAQLSG